MTHRRPGPAPLAALAAGLLLAAPARADFSVHYDAAARRISIVDNATGDVVVSPSPAIHQSVLTARSSPNDTTIEPSVLWAPHGDPSQADGLDLTFTFDNSAGSVPARPGPVFIPGITFGLPPERRGMIHTRDFYRDGKACIMKTQPPLTGWNTALDLPYPGAIYAPVAFLNAGRYAVGVSVLYLLIDPSWTSLEPCLTEYAHRVSLSIQMPYHEEAERAWRVRVAFNAADFGAGDPGNTEGLVPAHQVRSYTLCVRVTSGLPPVETDLLTDPIPENEPQAANGQQKWLRLFAPYKEYFAHRYAGVRYTMDPRPVLGCATAFMELVSPENPYGFAELPGGGGRPYPEGWGRWHAALQAWHANGWNRYMIWTPTGIFHPRFADYNYPFQFTSQWARQSVPGGEPSLLRDLTDGRGSVLGLWWGNSTWVMDSWPPVPGQAGPLRLDPADPSHRALARAEIDGATQTAGAGMIGLDAFAWLPVWKAYRWMLEMQRWAPGVRFVQEAQPCDIMATLSPGYITGTRPLSQADLAVLTPAYLPQYLTPGHELWATLEYRYIAECLGRPATEDDMAALAGAFARMGYVPLIYDGLSMTGRNLDARAPVGVVPCDLLAIDFLAQPPSVLRAASGAPVAVPASVSDAPVAALSWQCLRPQGWTDLSDTPGYIAGSRSQTLIFTPRSSDNSTLYRLRAAAPGGCRDTFSTPTLLLVCGSPDFNHDGDAATDADIEAFFACLAGHCCPTCDTDDFNADGDSATDADIEAFFRALAGGPC